MNPESFLNGRVQLHHGDSRDVLRAIPDASIDSVVTDPPYALVSIVKRFGSATAAPASGNDAYQRASAGFMGQTWDTGETAFAAEFWAEVLRVLKPGGYVVAASGTRTYHRLAVAIEDAGFEIRDMVSWLYGSGFPKSHDVSKGIDKAALSSPLFDRIRTHVRTWKDQNGFSNTQLNNALGLETNGCGMARHWTSEKGGQHSIPSKDQWRNLKRVLGWPDCELDAMYDAVKDGAERPVLAQRAGTKVTVAPGQNLPDRETIFDITAPATDAARQWEGWGTALKPACEPWVLARKPLVGTVAANVLKHGTGALNIGACRIGDEVRTAAFTSLAPCSGNRLGQADTAAARRGTQGEPQEYVGRWPANVIHDGSEEVTRLFPETGASSVRTPSGKDDRGVPGFVMRRADTQARGMDDAGGSAARFFYSAKADADDRLGSKHPTVKPVDLMQYLVRLITPKGGVTLDPFAGTGTTGEAAWREGMSAILIEREAAYADDIRRRLTLAAAGPDERKRESLKANGKAQSHEDLPLFGEVT